MLRLLVLGLICIGQFASAQVVSVRSGEHAGFTRLVFYFQEGRGWQLEPNDAGFLLQFDLRSLGFRDTGVFQKISRKRVADLVANRSNSSVQIVTNCLCEAEAYLHRPGMLVVDVADGDPFTELTSPIFVQDTIDAKEELARNQPTSITSDLPLLPSYDLGENPLATPIGTSQVLALPSPNSMDRIEDTRQEIMKELFRAREQGLLTPSQESGPDQLGVEAIDPLENIRAETSFDRGLNGGLGPALTADGDLCIGDVDLDIANWASIDGAVSQMSDFRSDLFNELDKANRDAGIGLAKTNLFLSFGSEAIAILDQLGIDGADANILREIATVMDNGFGSPSSVFEGQSTCPGFVALWGTLIHNSLPGGFRVDKQALRLAFSALPVHLRRHLGPDLALMFLEQGEVETAMSIRAAIERAPGDHGDGFDFLNANVALEFGDRDTAKQELENLAKSSGALSAEALISRIDMAIDGESDLPPGSVDSIAALAFEFRGTDIGARLARAYVVANIVEGRFDDAMSSLLRIETGEESERFVFPELWSQLALGMARTSDDAIFLSAYYKHREMLGARQVSSPARQKLAERLTRLGFGDAANVELSRSEKESVSKLLAARAELAANRPEKALSQLDGLESEEAFLLNAQIKEQLSKHSDAARAYQKLGREEEQLNAEWRAGNWTNLAQSGDGIRRIVAQLMTESDPYSLSRANDTDSKDAPGLIAANEQRLDHSVWLRRTIDTLLNN